MALGTATLDAALISNPGQVVYQDNISIAGEASYPTGGMQGLEAAFQAATKTGREVIGVEPVAACGGYVPRYDYVNKKLMLFVSNGAAPAALLELANATNVSAVTFKLKITSR